MNRDEGKRCVVVNGDCLNVMDAIQSGSVALTVTSPPYDDLRAYDGYRFDFERTAEALFRVVAKGGVIVWIVADQMIDGSESGTSFAQALHFKKLGFNLHDTMIWNKGNPSKPTIGSRYGQVAEYMFVLTKGKPAKFHPINDRLALSPGIRRGVNTFRQRDGTTVKSDRFFKVDNYVRRHNIWNQAPTNRSATSHPAAFPVQLALDHILTWTDEDDLVLDPFVGGGTTAVAAMQSKRRFIGAEISAKYCRMARARLGIYLNREDS